MQSIVWWINLFSSMFPFVISQQVIPPNITQCVSCYPPFHHFPITNTFLRLSPNARWQNPPPHAHHLVITKSPSSPLSSLDYYKTILLMIITWCISPPHAHHLVIAKSPSFNDHQLVLGHYKTLLPKIITWCIPRSFCAPSSAEQIPPSSLPPRNSCLSSDCLIFLDCIVFVGLSNSLPGVPLPLSVGVRGLLPNRRVVFPAVEIRLRWEKYLSMSWGWLSTKINWNTNTWQAKHK